MLVSLARKHSSKRTVVWPGCKQQRRNHRLIFVWQQRSVSGPLLTSSLHAEGPSRIGSLASSRQTSPECCSQPCSQSSREPCAVPCRPPVQRKHRVCSSETIRRTSLSSATAEAEAHAPFCGECQTLFRRLPIRGSCPSLGSCAVDHANHWAMELEMPYETLL
jgi:hypothetical protein